MKALEGGSGVPARSHGIPWACARRVSWMHDVDCACIVIRRGPADAHAVQENEVLVCSARAAERS